MPRKWICLWLGLTLAAVGEAAQEVVFGPWSVTVGAAGPQTIAYRGEVMATQGALGGYLPAWQGTRFTLNQARFSRTGRRLVWRQAEPGNQEATLTLELRPTSFRLSLQTTIWAEGPSEFSLQLAPEAVRTAEDYALVWVDGDLQSLPLGWPFDPVRGFRELRFEQAERTVTVRCPWFDLQDRRAGGDGFFVVQVISPRSLPAQVSSFIEVEVAPAAAATVPARREVLSQQPESFARVAVPNADFSATPPLDRWTDNPLAALDPGVGHDSPPAARLSITAAQTQTANPYLTQQIPVQEGHLYQAGAWIKTDGVEAASIGNRHSTGATVIVEYADQQGAWLASGSYATGVYGTRDWTHVVTAPSRAPEGAGYAIIFLALRATGTAWFDDVALHEVRKHVLPLRPLPGTTLADNTPTFDWYVRWQGPSFIDLSPDASFPPDRTRTHAVEGQPPITVATPLPPGEWFWRVRLPAIRTTSPVWRLTQTASLERDTTEPTIVERHGFLRESLDPVHVRFTDNVAVTRTRLVVDGREVTAGAWVTSRSIRYVPPRGWRPGLHRVVVQVWDAAGNNATRTLYFTHARSISTTTWLHTGGVERDGQRHFLFGLYGVHEPDMAEVAAAGFDYVHSYRWDGAGTDAEALAYLDEAHRHGLQAFIGFNRQRLMKGDLDFVATRVGALMGHPALLAWYLYDEPDLEAQYVSPALLERYYRLIKALDPFHPVIVTCAGDAAVPLYKDTCDVYWPQVYSTTAFVADRLDRTRGYLGPGKPLAAILHCFDALQTELKRRGEAVDPARFQPDALTLRANAFMAVAHNTSCLTWWEYEKQSPQFYSVAHVPAAWLALRQTLADLRALEPVLTAEGEIRTWVERPAASTEVHCWEKRLPDRTVLIAVNRDREPCEAVLRPGLMPAEARVQVLFEGREATVTRGELRDHFGPLGVHVYQGPAVAPQDR